MCWENNYLQLVKDKLTTLIPRSRAGDNVPSAKTPTTLFVGVTTRGAGVLNVKQITMLISFSI